MFMLCVSKVEQVKIKSLFVVLVCGGLERGEGVYIISRSYFKAKLEQDETKRQRALSCDEWLLDITQP